MRSGYVAAGVATAVALTACGSGGRQDASEPNGKFPVRVTASAFPASQTLAQKTQLVISVQNTGTRTIPDVAVTIINPRYGTAVQAFGYYVDMPGLASHSRAAWIVDQAPGPCEYSCQTGGPGGGVTSYSNTWALGALRPGRTATFAWHLTAVQPGTYAIAYRVAAGLNGKARAVTGAGTPPAGQFTATIKSTPAQAYVNNAGKIVSSR